MNSIGMGGRASEEPVVFFAVCGTADAELLELVWVLESLQLDRKTDIPRMIKVRGNFIWDNDSGKYRKRQTDYSASAFVEFSSW